jgi:hypothetical protein
MHIEYGRYSSGCVELASGHSSTRTNRLLIASSHYIYYDLQSRVLYLMREKKKTNQGIDEKRIQLQRVVELRKRQEE